MIKSRRLRRVGHAAKIGDVTSAFKILTGKSTGKIPLGRPYRWENNIKTNFKEIGINMTN